MTTSWTKCCATVMLLESCCSNTSVLLFCTFFYCLPSNLETWRRKKFTKLNKHLLLIWRTNVYAKLCDCYSCVYILHFTLFYVNVARIPVEIYQLGMISWFDLIWTPISFVSIFYFLKRQLTTLAYSGIMAPIHQRKWSESTRVLDLQVRDGSLQADPTVP